MDRRIVQSIDESDEEAELEALRRAALRSRGQKGSYLQDWESQSAADSRHVRLSCGERSVVETDQMGSSPSSQSTDYEEIDLSGLSPANTNGDLFADSEEGENASGKEDTVFDTPSDSENAEEENDVQSEDDVVEAEQQEQEDPEEEEVEEGGEVGDEGVEKGDVDSDIVEDPSFLVETDAGALDNLTITFANESIKNEYDQRTRLESDQEEAEGEAEEEELGEGEDDELKIAVDPTDEGPASSNGSDIVSQEVEDTGGEFLTNDTRIVFTESEGEEDSTESAPQSKPKQHVSVNGSLAEGSVQTASTSTVVATKDYSLEVKPTQKIPISKKPGKLIRELSSKNMEQKEWQNESGDSKKSTLSESKKGPVVSKGCSLSKSKPGNQNGNLKEMSSSKLADSSKVGSRGSPRSQPKPVKTSVVKQSTSKDDREQSNLTTVKNSKVAPKSITKEANNGLKNGSKAKLNKDEPTRLCSTVCLAKETPKKSPLSQGREQPSPQMENTLDNDADRLSIGTSDEDSEFEQSEEQPVIKSKAWGHKILAVRRDSRERSSPPRDRSNSPRRSWTHEREQGKFRSVDTPRVRDRSRLRGRSRSRDRYESHGRTRHKRSPVRRDRSRDRLHERNRGRRSQRSPVDRRRNRSRSQSREKKTPYRDGTGSREGSRGRKRSWSYDSKSRESKLKRVPRSAVTSTMHKLSEGRMKSKVKHSSTSLKEGGKDKKLSIEKDHKSDPPKKVKAVVVVNEQKESVRHSPSSKSHRGLPERKKEEGESDLRAKLKTTKRKDSANSRTKEKNGPGAVSVCVQETKKESWVKADETKAIVTLKSSGKRERDAKRGKIQEQSKETVKRAERPDEKTSSGGAGEEDLDSRIAKIREQNRSILRRAREVQADKVKAFRSKNRVF